MSTVDETAAVCEFLVRCGVSDHPGHGITASGVADHVDSDRDFTRKKLNDAVKRGDLEHRPAIVIGKAGNTRAYHPPR